MEKDSAGTWPWLAGRARFTTWRERVTCLSPRAPLHVDLRPPCAAGLPAVPCLLCPVDPCIPVLFHCCLYVTQAKHLAVEKAKSSPGTALNVFKIESKMAETGENVKLGREISADLSVLSSIAS